MTVMTDACLAGDEAGGRLAEQNRNAKIDMLGLDVAKVNYDELVELSKIITAEAGSSWLSMDWKLKVGEVVLNRVASPEFPDTIYDVIHQSGQYARTNTAWFRGLEPFESCVEAASRLLSGERVLNDGRVVYQATKKQGGGVAEAMYDSYYGHTYLCYTSNPDLYMKEGR